MPGADFQFLDTEDRTFYAHFRAFIHTSACQKLFSKRVDLLSDRRGQLPVLSYDELTERQQRELEYHQEFARAHQEILEQP